MRNLLNLISEARAKFIQAGGDESNAEIKMHPATFYELRNEVMLLSQAEDLPRAFGMGIVLDVTIERDVFYISNL